MTTRGGVAAALGIAFGMFVCVAAWGLGAPLSAAGALGVAAAAVTGAAILKRPDLLPLDDAAASRALRVTGGVAAVLALVVVGRLAVFMLAPDRPEFSFVPGSTWEVQHSCATAYYVAAGAAGEGRDVYDDALYSEPGVDATQPRRPLMLGPFRIDVYEYPPPFLLLPRLLRRLAPEFTRFRALCFGIGSAFVLAAMLAVGRLLGPGTGTRALLLSPLVWLAVPTWSLIQKGNVQGAILVGSMLAMVLIENRRDISGGAILAFATVSKLYPGLLVVYLLATRRHRAVAWTAFFGAAFAVAGLADTGWAPYGSFLAHLSGLLSGEAFPAFRNPMAIAINFSIPGLVFKARLFGLTDAGFGAAKAVGWIYTILAAAIAWGAGRLVLREVERPLVWLAILVLATLRSPFLPEGYAAFPVLWLLTLIGATYLPSARVLFLVLAGWLFLNIYWPIDWPIDPRTLAAINFVPQILTVALTITALRRRVERESLDA